MQLRIVSYAIVFGVLTTHVLPSEILVIFPTTAQSHYRVVRPLIRGLLDRGHKVLSITNFPDDDGIANLSHINISGIKPHSKMSASDWGMTSYASRVVKNANTYSTILDFPPVVNILKSGKKFDLVIAEFFVSTPMFAPIAAVVDAPIVGVCPMIVCPWMYELMGMETKTSYIPSAISALTDRESFSERLFHYIKTKLYDLLFDWIYNPAIREINKRYYNIEMNSLLEPMSNISMILVNNHHSMFTSLPRAPGIVEIGGIHVVDAKPLSQVNTSKT